MTEITNNRQEFTIVSQELKRTNGTKTYLKIDLKVSVRT